MGLIYDGIRIAQAAGKAHQEHAAAREEAAREAAAAEQARRLDAAIHSPGTIIPGEQAPDGDTAEPGELRFVLDETAEFIARHVAATDAQVTAMTLYAAATHGIRAFPTFGRMLFTSEREAAGKTVAMMVTATLSANPLDASGTSYALTSALAAAGNTPEQPPPALYYDEISGLFGKSGLAASRNPIGDILRKGYKSSATSQWSVNRVNEKFSIFTPFLVTGLRVAVPRDIRSRCICITMKAATPEAYFDAREAEPEAEALSACLGQAAAQCFGDLLQFRARHIYPKLRDRLLEVWEPLFAVAYVIGGQEWLNKCLAAFRELALAESESVVLTPRQQTIRDVAEVTAGSHRKITLPGDGTEFIDGHVIADGLRRLAPRNGEAQRYAGRTDAGIGKMVSEALGINVIQIRIGRDRVVRGHYVADILAAWERIRPAELEDVEIPEETDPYAVTDGADDLVVADEIPGQEGAEGVSAGQEGVDGETPTRYT
jgi:hypothetical protein